MNDRKLAQINECNCVWSRKIDKNGNRKKIEKVFDHSDKKKNNKNKVEEPAPEPETKICPYCLTEIKYKATRCPHCTSILESKKLETVNETNDSNITSEE